MIDLVVTLLSLVDVSEEVSDPEVSVESEESLESDEVLSSTVEESSLDVVVSEAPAGLAVLLVSVPSVDVSVLLVSVP